MSKNRKTLKIPKNVEKISSKKRQTHRKIVENCSKYRQKTAVKILKNVEKPSKNR